MRWLHAARAALLSAGVLSFGLSALGAEVSTTASADRVSLTEGGEAKMPSGFAALCVREPQFCRQVAAGKTLLPLTREHLDLLRRVNTSVNRQIASTTDEILYGRLEYWTLPVKQGDCEDFVLLKRQMLEQQGVPAAALLITVVQDERGEGHAVLTVPTSGGDLVLDNRRDEVLNWRDTGYSFVKRQSAANPNSWVSLGMEELQATNIASAPEAPPLQ